MSARTLSIPPFARLIALAALGGGAFAFFSLLLLMPITGWTWNVQEWRPIWETGAENWVSLLTGLLAYLVSAWIWALKPRNVAAILFAASGLMTLLFCFSASGMATALLLSDAQFIALIRGNIIGASGFGIIVTCLFIIYPGQLPRWRTFCTFTVVFFSAWTLLRTFGPYQKFEEVQAITFIEMIAIVAAVIGQIFIARHDPRQRAIAVWLGTATILGAGAFISTVAIPITFNQPPLLVEKYAFAFFLVIYIGLAVGLLRYRLFDLGGWAYTLAFYVSAAILLIALDVALIGLLTLEPGQALGASLLLVALLYLPLRDLIWRRVTRGKRSDETELFHQVLDASLQPSPENRIAAWERLLQNHFQPLDMETSQTTETRLEEEGIALSIPSVGVAPALQIRYPKQGRSLFTPRDCALVEQLVSLMRHADESRHAYDRGVSEERTRIARDIHDNIGAQLMRALHSETPERKDTQIRDTLADLRDVINNAQSPVLPLEDMLADLRAETADRLEPHGIALDWTLESEGALLLSPSFIHALRSLVREAASNTIKHASADRLTVSIRVTELQVQLHIEDNGQGFTIGTVTLGQGLGNMKARVESLGGAFSLEAGSAGARLSASLPREGHIQ